MEIITSDKKKNNFIILNKIELIKNLIGKENLFVGDILNYFEIKKIGIFNTTKGNITILESIVRNYLKLDQEIDKLTIYNKKNLVKLFEEFNLI